MTAPVPPSRLVVSGPSATGENAPVVTPPKALCQCDACVLTDTAEPVHFDAVRGHVRVGELTFADLGNATLHVWSHERCVLTPKTARDLATALNAWADRWPRLAANDGSHAHG